MEFSLAKTERAYVKLIMGGLAGLLVFILLCWGGFRFYRNWEQGHLVRRARAFMSGGDLRTAGLNARRAMQLNPANVDATRVVALIAERTGDPTALDWRRKVLELNPGSVDDSLAFVRCALRFNDLAAAEKTLGEIESRAKTKAEFQAASGRLAEMKKDMPAAEEHWAQAAELAPNESGYRFQLGLIRLGMRDPARRAAGLTSLESLRTDPKERAVATRALIIDGLARHSDPQRVRDLARELQDFPDAPFSDHILYLEILREMRDPAYPDYLAKLKATVPARATDLASLLSWMVRNQMNAEALAFADSLPAKIRSEWPVPLALAEAYAQAQDWPQLERLTKSGSWSPYEFLRRAFLARAFRGQDNKLAAKEEMVAAEREAGNNPQALSTLAQTVGDWGWTNEAIGLLWVLAKNPDTRMAALQKLYQHYAKLEDTAGLYRTLEEYANVAPNDTIRNNLAQISLLLGVEVEHARRLAAELHEKDPANAAYLSTYAFGLLSKGETKEALKVMDGLSAEQLRDPSVATYYGLVLAAAGQKEKARGYLSRSAEANLLPEEKKLVAKARSSLD